MKILRKLLALLAIVAIAVAGFVIERRHALAEADRETVANIDRALPSALAADAELAQRLGRFVRLEGSGYRRPKYFMYSTRSVKRGWATTRWSSSGPTTATWG